MSKNYISEVKQATRLLDYKQISLQDWICRLLGEEYRGMYSDEYCRRCAKVFSAFVDRLDKEGIDNVDDVNIVEDLKKLKEEVKDERIKTQTKLNEYNAVARAEARADLFNELISEAIKNLPRIEFKQSYVSNYPNECEGVLCIADAHNGVEINMKSLFGEVVNVYNPDIFKARLSKLLNDVVSDKDKYMDYTKLTVFDLGDAIQGILRLSDLSKLKSGVIDSALDYAETISQWLVALSDGLKMPIEYICLGGNHCELRLIGSRKGDFENENIGKVIQRFVALRLADNPNITVAPYSECGFKSIQGVNILAYHGDDAKSDSEEISFWEQYHQIDIDILIEAHLHHKIETGVGYALNGGDKEVIHVPSLVGADTFGKRCRKISRAGAKFMLFEDGAKTWEKTYHLN